MMNSLLTDIAFTGDFEASPTGDFDTMSGLTNLKEALYRRLITEKGSLLHRPTYGVGILQYMNGPNTLSAQQKIARDIMENFKEDERVEQVLEVAAIRDPDNPSKAHFIIKVLAKGHGQVDLNFGVEV